MQVPPTTDTSQLSPIMRRHYRHVFEYWQCFVFLLLCLCGVRNIAPVTSVNSMNLIRTMKGLISNSWDHQVGLMFGHSYKKAIEGPSILGGNFDPFHIQVVLLIMHGTWRRGLRTFSHKRGIYLCALVSFVSMSHQVGCKLDTGRGREFRMSFRWFPGFSGMSNGCSF